MTFQMIEVLLSVENYVQIFAFALLLVAGIKLFRDTRRRAIAVFSLGMAMVLLSFLAVSISSDVLTSRFTSDGGWDPTSTQLALVWIAGVLNAVGLLVSAAGLALYSFRLGRNTDAT